MMGKYTAKILLSASMLLSSGSVAGADTVHINKVATKIEGQAMEQAKVNRIKLFELLKEASVIQTSFGEKTFTTEEINTIMNPYFSQKFIKKFISENMIEFEEGKYGILGSDFAPNMIPYFSYNSKTDAVIEGKDIVISEFFESVEDAPVTYKGHKEGIKLIKEDGKWKIDEVIYEWKEDYKEEEISLKGDIPEENPKFVETNIPSEKEAVTLTSFFSWKPYQAAVGSTVSEIISEWDRIFSLKTWQK